MRKVMIKISPGNVVTQTVLGGLSIHLPVANFLCLQLYICQKLWKLTESRPRYCKFCNEHRVQFIWPTLYICTVITLKIGGEAGQDLGGLCPPGPSLEPPLPLWSPRDSSWVGPQSGHCFKGKLRSVQQLL